MDFFFVSKRPSDKKCQEMIQYKKANLSISLLKVASIIWLVTIVKITFLSIGSARALASHNLEAIDSSASISYKNSNDDKRQLHLLPPEVDIHETQASAPKWPRSKRQLEGRRQVGQPASSQHKSNQSSTVLPEFASPIGNVTAVLGRDVRLVCTVDNLGSYQVAWLKEETKTILSIGTNIIIANYRIFLIPDEEERKWVLHIEDVRESDRGLYQCQINTKPTRSTFGYLEVVSPPQIIENQSSQVAEVIEHSNVSIQCKANGHPKPTITWRREGGMPIKLTGDSQGPNTLTTAVMDQESQSSAFSKLDEIKSDKLTLTNVDRSMSGQYVCTATNGIPSPVSKTIPVYVKFPPKVSTPSKFVSASLGDQLELDCLIESFPRADSYWSKQQQRAKLKHSKFHMLPTKDRLLLSSSLNNSNKLMLANSDEALAGAWPQRHAIFRPDKPTSDVASSQRDGTTTIAPRETFTIGSNGDLAKRSQREAKSSHQDSRSTDFESVAIKPDLGNDESIKSPAETNEQSKRISLVSSQTVEFGETIGRHLAQESKMSESSKRLPIIATNINNGQQISVKQTPLSAHLYRLRLTIAQMSPNDFGEYICYSSNLLGSSETNVIVMMADKQQSAVMHDDEIDERRAKLSLSEANDKIKDEMPTMFVQVAHPNKRPEPAQRLSASNQWSSSSPGGRIYDENYLQAIKSRQAGNLATSTGGARLQTPYQLRANVDKRNSGHKLVGIVHLLSMVCSACLAISLLVVISLMG